MLKKVGENLFRRYSIIAVICLFLTFIYFLYQATNIGVDYDFEKFFPSNDPETSFFLEHRQKFESDNDFLLISIENKGGIYDLSFLKKVDKFAGELRKVKDVKVVLSITDQKEYFIRAKLDSMNYINFTDVDLKRDSTRISEKAELINSLVAKDGQSLCLFLKHTDYLSKKRSDKLISTISAKSKKYEFDKIRMAGRTVGQKYYIENMAWEMVFFISLSAILVILFLVIAFRSIWGILIPQVIIFSGAVWLIGGMALFEQPINIILTVLPSVMFVVSMSDVIHLVSRYLDALREVNVPYKAIQIAVTEVGLATFLTSITTAIGFFSLVFVRVEPIQVFGIVMGIGVMIAFFLTFLVLPALFYLFPGPSFVREKKKDNFWKRRLERWFLVIARNKYKVVSISVGVMALSIVGIFQMDSDNLIMDDLRDSEPIKQDFNYLDKHYGGVRPFEMAVTIKDTSLTIWDEELLNTLDTVETYLEEVYGVGLKMSLVKSMKVLNRSMYSGLAEYYKLPDRKSKRKDVRRILKTAQKGKLLRTMVDSTETVIRISGGIPDMGNKAVSERNKKLYAFLKDKTLDGKVEYAVTGTAHLIDKNMGYMSSSLVKGLAVSILIVALIMGLIYRSATILVISIIPNIVPLVFIGGVMGFMGVDLKISTAIIFTIAFGIAVDDTIHLLGKFKHELLKGKGTLYALRRSYLTTGKAMILTTLILCSGFALLVFSSFLGTFYLGVLLCAALFVALIADLTLLPVLILLFYRSKPKVRK